MDKKLSDLLSELAAKTIKVEKEIEQARQVSAKLLDKKIEESKAELQRTKAEFIIHAEAVNVKSKEGWDSFKKSLDLKVEQVKAQVQEKKEIVSQEVAKKKQELNIESAERHYNNSLDYATFCIEWAIVALSEVESATLESFAAKQNLESLKTPVLSA